MSRHEAAKHAVRAVVSSDKIVASAAKQLTPFARAYADGLVKVLKKAKTYDQQVQALITYASDKQSPEALVYAIRRAVQEAEMLGAASAAAEAATPVKGTPEEVKATQHRLDTYAVEVARRMRLGMLQDALDILKHTDGTPEELASHIASTIRVDWGDPKALRIDLTAGTSVKSALNYGRMKVLRRPIVRANLPYWFFTAILDLRTGEICWDCDRTCLPAGHPWWSTHTPLLHFRCRSAIVGVSKAMAQKLGITERPPDVFPQEGFGSIGGLCKLPERPKNYSPELLNATR